jgi:hypothetical protein
LGEVADILVFLGDQLVDDDADDLDAFLVEERLVDGDLIDGTTDAALGN